MFKITYILLFLALAATAQDNVTVEGPQWDKGVVAGQTYRNTSIGVELTSPSGLRFLNPDLKGTPGKLPLLVTITAVGGIQLSSARDVMSFYSDALAYYPKNFRSTGIYMLRVVRHQRDNGYKPIQAYDENQIFGGIDFYRRDFTKGIVYQGVLVRACEAQVLVFIFGGSDRDAVNKLMAATNLKLDTVRSGCH